MSVLPRKTVSELRKFGVVLGVILIAITLYQWQIRDRLFEILGGIGFLFILAGAFFPNLLHSIYRPWMWCAEKIGFVMNRLILTVFYIVFFTPIALIRRLFNRDPLELKLDKTRESYFDPRAIQTPEYFKHLF